MQTEPAEGAQELKTKAPRAERKPRIPEHLPVIEQIIVDPEEAKAAPEAYCYVSDAFTTQIDFKPRRFTRRLVVSRKYVKSDEPHTAHIIAQLDTLAELRIPAPGLLAQITGSSRAERESQPQASPKRGSAEGRREANNDRVSQVRQQRDQEGLLLDAQATGRRRHVRLAHKRWTASSMQTSAAPLAAKVTACIKQSHANRSSGRIRLAVCWAHVRRSRAEREASRWPPRSSEGRGAARSNFDEAKAGNARPAASVLPLVQQLYRIENQLGQSTSQASAKLRQVKRADHSQRDHSTHRRIAAALERQRQVHAAESHGQSHRLRPHAVGTPASLSHRRQCRDRQHPRETGAKRRKQPQAVRRVGTAKQNAIHLTAVGSASGFAVSLRSGQGRSAAGRWLFFDDADTDRRSAIMFTIIEAGSSRCIDPWEYLRDVLTRLPSIPPAKLDDVMPDGSMKARRASPQSKPLVSVARKCQAVG